MHREENPVKPHHWLTYVILVGLLSAVLVWAKSIHYLLFHNLAEQGSAIVFGAVFLLVWNARKVLENGFLICVGMASLPVAVLDWLHSMAYWGMPIFQSYGKNLATQLWVEARFIQATSVLVGLAFLLRPKPNAVIILVLWCVLASILVTLSFTGIFPVCFVEGSGLTLFKRVLEHLVSIEFGVTLYLIVRNRSHFDREVLRMMVAFLGAAVVSELCFTLYTDVYGFSNFSGHVLKIAGAFFLYRAIVGVGLRKPYALLFREMALREDALKKTLQGIFPICSGCKKIRDEKGAWMQIETYISHHSNAEFSHSICPDCRTRLYPELAPRPNFPTSDQRD